MVEPSSTVGFTNEDMAAEAKVSKCVIQHVKAVTASGLNRLVVDGTLTAKHAVEIAKLPLKC